MSDFVIPNSVGADFRAAINIALAGLLATGDSYRPNPIRNGAFQIAQRGTSFAAHANGSYDLDGWQNGNVSAAVLTVAQAAGSTTGRNARQVTITTADASVAAGDYMFDLTRIEGYNIVKYVGQTFTIAFRMKVPVAGIHCVALRNSAADRSYVKEINFPTANAWQDCSITVTGGLPTAGTWNYTNGNGLIVEFTHICGSTYQTTPDAWQTGNFFATANQVNDCATIGNVWAIEEVRIGLGTVAPAMETDYHAELARSYRYYSKTTNTLRYTKAAAAQYMQYFLPVAMRATPTLITATADINDGAGFSLTAPLINNMNVSFYTSDTTAGFLDINTVELSAEL